jgi:NAD(P)-dependent dehydrogenase (short-subunit alcohol dehydrogenase family)
MWISLLRDHTELSRSHSFITRHSSPIHTLAPKGIRANTVSPENIYIADGVWGAAEKSNPELFHTLLAKNPMQRMGKSEEIVNTVNLLASEKASSLAAQIWLLMAHCVLE